MSTPMSMPAQEPPSSDGAPSWMYWAVGTVVVVLAVIGVIAFGAQERSEEAVAKAQELTQKFEQAGLPVPRDQDILVRTLGTDGGAVCEDPGNALGKAVLYDQLANGASHVGRRPVIADNRFVQGELLIVETYCPDELEDFRDAVEDLKFDDTVDLG